MSSLKYRRAAVVRTCLGTRRYLLHYSYERSQENRSQAMTQINPPPRPRAPHLTIAAQLAVVAVLGLGLLGIFFRVQLVGSPLASQAAGAKPPAEPGAFRPTKEQWAGISVETVRVATFHPERVTEGNIAIDDDLTTPVFSPYSGRVIR